MRQLVTTLALALLPAYALAQPVNICVQDSNGQPPAHMVVQEVDPFTGETLPHPVSGNPLRMEVFGVSCVSPELATGIQSAELPESQSLSLYPLPANDELFLEWTAADHGPVHLTITDLLARQVFRSSLASMPGTRKVGLDVSRLGSGVYAARIASSSSVTSGLFVLTGTRGGGDVRLIQDQAASYEPGLVAPKSAALRSFRISARDHRTLEITQEVDQGATIELSLSLGKPVRWVGRDLWNHHTVIQTGELRYIDELSGMSQTVPIVDGEATFRLMGESMRLAPVETESYPGFRFVTWESKPDDMLVKRVGGGWDDEIPGHTRLGNTGGNGELLLTSFVASGTRDGAEFVSRLESIDGNWAGERAFAHVTLDWHQGDFKPEQSNTRNLGYHFEIASDLLQDSVRDGLRDSWQAILDDLFSNTVLSFLGQESSSSDEASIGMRQLSNSTGPTGNWTGLYDRDTGRILEKAVGLPIDANYVFDARDLSWGLSGLLLSAGGWERPFPFVNETGSASLFSEGTRKHIAASVALGPVQSAGYFHARVVEFNDMPTRAMFMPPAPPTGWTSIANQ